MAPICWGVLDNQYSSPKISCRNLVYILIPLDSTYVLKQSFFCFKNIMNSTYDSPCSIMSVVTFNRSPFWLKTNMLVSLYMVFDNALRIIHYNQIQHYEHGIHTTV
jgi:hypothetical protein